MDVITEVIGNIHQPEWAARVDDCHIETVFLDQWTAQKSRFLAKGDHGNEYPVALTRGSRIADGDIIAYDPEARRAAVLRLDLNNVLVIDLSKLSSLSPEDIIRVSVELGHAIGNQLWPAVVKVMLSVMETHNIDNITYEFQEGKDIIPFLAPVELRRLFGGAGHNNTDLEHPHHHHHHH